MKLLNFSVQLMIKLKRIHVPPYNLFRQKIFVIYTSCRPFYITNPCKVKPLLSNGGKLFQESENEYAHEVMEKLPCYSNSLLKCPLISENCVENVSETVGMSNNLNAVDKFVQITLNNLSESLSLEDTKFTNVVKELCYQLPDASDENIKKVLHYLCMWPASSSTKTKNFRILWNLLDEECVKRFKNWDVNQKLLIGDYWFRMKLSRISSYNSYLIDNLVADINSLSNHQVVQLMFYIALQRRIPDHFVPQLEKKLESIIKFLTIEEIGIICLAFFKTKNKISNANLVQYILKDFMYNVENLSTITASAILKFLRKSRDFSLIDTYILTLHKCTSCINNFDIPTSVHLALLSSECNVYHPLLLNCVSEKLEGEMKNVRIKDCAKFLSSLSLHSHFDCKFFSVYFNELKKKERGMEIISYPNHVVNSVLSCTYTGHYDYDVLALIFQNDFLEKCTSQYPESRTSYAEIDYCIEIDCPDYTGPKLDLSERKILQTRRGNLPSKSADKNMSTRLLREVNESLLEILGDNDNILIRHILPHAYTPDIIVRLSGNKEKSLNEICQEIPLDIVLKQPKDEVWAAFVVCGTFSFAYKSTQMSGISSMKIRQLQKLGYHVISIPYFNVYRNPSRRREFLKEKLNLLEKNIK